MGQSTPTTTMALDTFEQRYAGFRSELAPREQFWFDELVCRARRHSNAINRRPSLDFERPVLLSMLLEGMREVEDTRRALEATRLQLEEACKVLADAGLITRRPTPTSVELDKLGQTRLLEHRGHEQDTRGRLLAFDEPQPATHHPGTL